MTALILIWSGAGLTTVGLVLLVWLVLAVRKARGNGDKALRERMARILPWHMAALALATLGLLMVIMGIVMR